MALIDSNTQLCGVMGHPVGHSLSPVMHNAGYAALGLNFVYLAFDVVDVGGALRGMRALGSFRGLSVTIPHKQAVIEHLDEVELLARSIGSVNTITHEDGRLIGSSTDGAGTLRALDEAGVSVSGKRVLFTGCGGAVRAVAFAVGDAGAASMTILGRNAEKVQRLTDDLAGASYSVSAGSLEDAGDTLAECDVLVQGTPMGLQGEAEGETCIPAAALRPEHAVFDMVYKPRETRLIREARAAGATVVTGDEMLLHQGALQFERWTGKAAPVDTMRTALRAALG